MITSASCRLYTSEEIAHIASLRINENWDLEDPRFGPDCVNTRNCPTCKEDHACTGHLGYIDLHGWIANPLMMGVINKMLSRICVSCERSFPNADNKRCTDCDQALGGVICEDNVSERRSHSRKLSFDESRKLINKCHPDMDRCFTNRIIIPPRFMRQSSSDRNKQSPLVQPYRNLAATVKRHASLSTVFKIYRSITGSGESSSDDNTILSLLSGKQGIFRDLIIGKRVEECGRTVIIGDDNLDIDQVGIPRIIANHISVTIKVNNANLDQVRSLASRGLLEDVGNHHPTVLDVKPGRCFRRKLMDGDMVMVNRQPSLTRNSLMALRAKVENDDRRVISINTAVTPAYNADFDGDEMNVFFQDDISSVSETRNLMSASDNVIAPGTSKPVIHPVQDSLTCVYILTKNVERIDRCVYNDYYIHCSSDRYMRKECYSTRDLISLCLPPKFHFSSHDMLIEDGDVISGVLDKSTLCTGDENVLQVMYLTHGSKAALTFVSKLQKLASRWTTVVGMGMRFSDVNTQETISMTDILGDDISSLANNIRARAEMMVMKSPVGVLDAIVACGSKGNMTNLAQTRIIVGQQMVLGRIPQSSIDIDAQRTTVDRMRAMGFCTSSYLKGLDVTEYMFHQMAGREGVARVNISTSVAGYLSRRVIKPLSSLHVGYNNTVHSSTRVVRLQHGSYGFDTSKCLNNGVIISENIINNL